ncbi:MAG: type II and III secretion system protein family protein [Pseudomonadota bacterium]
MLKFITFGRQINVAAAATAALAVAASGLIAGQASAEDHRAPVLRSAYGSKFTGQTKRMAPRVGHSSNLTVTDRDRLPMTKAISIGRNKSMLVEVPRTLRDVVVSDPEIVDAVVQTSDRVYLIGKKVGQANAFFFDEHGEQMLTLELRVEVDTKPLDTLLERLIPGSQVKSEMLNDTLILTGRVRTPLDSNRAFEIAMRFAVTADPQADSTAANKVVNMLSVDGEEQVMLRVKVAEVQRSILKQFGINLGAQINAGNFSTTFLTENALPLTAAAGLGTLPSVGNFISNGTPGQINGLGVVNQGPSASGGQSGFGNSGLAGTWRGGNQALAHTMRALERTGLIRTLAEPNLTTVSGEAAKFLAGGEYPLPLVDGDGALSVLFKQFGVGLTFTPNVLSEGRISLKIETEVSELTNDGAVTLSSVSIPALKKRLAKTVVELPSGGSLAMAGLVSEDTRQNVDGFPGLKDLPVLGTLFRSRDFIKSETELVIIVTPYVVKPTSQKNLRTPGDGLIAASDRKANFLGHLNRIYGKGAPAPDGGLKGDFGFIVE